MFVLGYLFGATMTLFSPVMYSLARHFGDVIKNKLEAKK